MVTYLKPTLLSWQHGSVSGRPHDGTEGVPQGPESHDQTVQCTTLLPTPHHDRNRMAYTEVHESIYMSIQKNAKDRTTKEEHVIQEIKTV